MKRKPLFLETEFSRSFRPVKWLVYRIIQGKKNPAQNLLKWTNSPTCLPLTTPTGQDNVPQCWIFRFSRWLGFVRSRFWILKILWIRCKRMCLWGRDNRCWPLSSLREYCSDTLIYYAIKHRNFNIKNK